MDLEKKKRERDERYIRRVEFIRKLYERIDRKVERGM